jgi:hypothetical protein
MKGVVPNHIIAIFSTFMKGLVPNHTIAIFSTFMKGGAKPYNCYFL